MKLDSKKLFGQINLDYKIEVEIKDYHVVFSLLLKFDGDINYTFFDCVTGAYDSDVESSSKGIVRCIESAFKKWGIDLVKSESIVNKMIKDANDFDNRLKNFLNGTIN